MATARCRPAASRGGASAAAAGATPGATASASPDRVQSSSPRTGRYCPSGHQAHASAPRTATPASTAAPARGALPWLQTRAANGGADEVLRDEDAAEDGQRQRDQLE